MVHPHLDVPSRQLACGELIAALEECHAKGLLYKISGGCNDQKYALGLCLRQERIDRTTRNREAAKERTKKKTDAFEAYDREIKEG